MKKIIITADSTTDMPPEIAKENGIIAIPSYVVMGEKSLDDYPDVTQNDLFEFYNNTKILPKTAAASPDDYTRAFTKLLDGETAIIHLAKSSGISSCCDNAKIAAKELKDVYVVDTKNLSGGSALIAEYAVTCDEPDAEKRVKLIEDYVEKADSSFLIESLEFLKKGGRCSSLALLGANLLKIRPEIVVRDGKMSVAKKYRGNYENCLRSYFDEIFNNTDDIDPTHAVIAHTIRDKAFLDRLVDYVKSKDFFEKLDVWEASAAISCHCGPNTLGICLMRKTPVVKQTI